MLIFTLFFLCCALLCGSVLAVNLSDQLEVSGKAVQKEQSRLLAQSGWNFVLEQLQLAGPVNALYRTTDSGEFEVTMKKSNATLAGWDITARGTSGVYDRTVTGMVQCFPFPFSNTTQWPVVTVLNESDSASILLVEDTTYQLCAETVHQLGITSANDLPVTVTVSDEVSVDRLYVYGDLHVSGALVADCIYVTGTIQGADLIDCAAVYHGYTSEIPYQIRVLERNSN